MLPQRKIEEFWRISPNLDIEDWCKGTGQNIIRIMVRKWGIKKPIVIVSKRLNPIFYDTLVEHFYTHILQRKIKVFVYEDVQSSENNKFFDQLLERQLIYKIPCELLESHCLDEKVRRPRFFMIGDESIRLSIHENPYRARSFLNNDSRASLARAHVEKLDEISTVYHSAQGIDA